MKKFRIHKIDYSLYMIPLLVFSCSLLALVGYTFSAKIISFDEASNKASNDTKNIMNFDDSKNIISNSLDSVRDNQGTSYYYKGDARNNYILLQGLLFRIVRINGDGSLRIILNEDVLQSEFNSDYYSESDAKKVLDEWFTTNIGKQSYIVKGEFDIHSYEEYNFESLEFYSPYFDYVGLLSVREMNLIQGDLDTTYLDSINGMYLSNGTEDAVWYYKSGKIGKSDIHNRLSLRPVINIQVDHLDGLGTIDYPYTF